MDKLLSLGAGAETVKTGWILGEQVEDWDWVSVTSCSAVKKQKQNSWKVNQNTDLSLYFCAALIFTFCTHHGGWRYSCRTCLPCLPHGSTSWSNLTWLGLALPHAHVLYLGWRLLLRPGNCSGTRLPWPGCWCLGLLLELGPLSWSPVCLGHWTTLSSWSWRPASGTLITGGAAARPGGAWMDERRKVKFIFSIQ